LDPSLVPTLEVEMGRIISEAQGSVDGLSQNILKAYAELSKNAINFSALESTSFAGISDGLSLVSEKPQQEAQPVQPPVAEKVYSTTFYGWEIADRQEFAQTSTVFLSVPEFNPQNFKDVFKFDSVEYKLVESFRLPFDQSSVVSDSEAISLIKNLNLSEGQSIIIVKGKGGYSYLVAQENNIPAYAGNVQMDRLSFDKSSGLSWIDITKPDYELGYSPEERELAMLPDTYKEINLREIDPKYQEVIKNTSGISDTIFQLYQAEKATCNAAAISTIVSQLVSFQTGERVNFNLYELGEYITSFYNDYNGADFDYITEALPTSEIRQIEDSFDVEKLKKELVSTSDSIQKQEIQAKIDYLSSLEPKQITELIRDEVIMKVKDLKAWPYYRHVIQNEVYTDIAYRDSISALLGLNINVEGSDVFDTWKNTYGLDPLAKKYTYQSDFVSETVLNNVDGMVNILFDELDKNMKPGTLAYYGSYIHKGKEYAMSGDKYMLDKNGDLIQSGGNPSHAFTIVGVNSEEKYIIVSESNLFDGHWTGGYTENMTSDSTMPTMKIITTSSGGLYKISFNTDEYTPQQVAQTLSSINTLQYFKTLTSNE